MIGSGEFDQEREREFGLNGELGQLQIFEKWEETRGRNLDYES